MSHIMWLRIRSYFDPWNVLFSKIFYCISQFIALSSFAKPHLGGIKYVWQNPFAKMLRIKESIQYSFFNILRNCLNIKIINLVKLLNCITKSDLKLDFAWMECPGSWGADGWQIQMWREAKWSSALAGKNMIYHPHASQLINVQSKTKFWFA